MKLQEEFYPYCQGTLSDQEENALYCVCVADNFTISFVQWLDNIDYVGMLTNKELLEIYKKEIYGRMLTNKELLEIHKKIDNWDNTSYNSLQDSRDNKLDKILK